MKLYVSPQAQTLSVHDEQDVCTHTYAVSTSRFGLGEKKDSYKTPRGWHRIVEKFGQDQPINAVFVGRKPTGEIYSEAADPEHPRCDWILTRILWLGGLEPGMNQGGDIDTQSRLIYIHGTPDRNPLGTPDSHGCIRMHNKDVIDLFDFVPVGAELFIGDGE